MPSLSRLLSRSGEAKERDMQKTASKVPVDSPPPAPPPYTKENIDAEDALVPSDLTAGFANLKLDSAHTQPIPQREECIAHLKLLESFYRLRQSIGSNDGLFGISDSLLSSPYGRPAEGEELNRCRAVISEKRWQVYVSRAVLRFEHWRNAVEPKYDYLHVGDMPTNKLEETVKTPSPNRPKVVGADNLPPLDVLMVWHSYMLNPRAYLEDCALQGRMSLWHCPMPWQAIAQCINNNSFVYQPPGTVQEAFEANIGIKWDNLGGPNDAMVMCVRCFTMNSVPWTACGAVALGGRQAMPNVLSDHFSDGTGYADRNFTMTCKSCSQRNNHDSLCVGKFLKDVRHLLDEDVLMPGTILDSRSGLPIKSTKLQDAKFLPTFPSRLLKAGLGSDILRYCNAADSFKMTSIRTYIEEGLHDKRLLQVARGSLSYVMLRDERVSIRRMMSRYWENSSSFALDLVGAVTRQGDFVEKMHNIDWLHSPALPSTMHRLVVKYIRFVDIMKDKHHMAVPTLDIDLAWHTHQLSPLSYLQYTVAQTGQFIDHDDKVAETKLTDAFAWTSKTYQKLYDEPYSECTCWYCEAIRESHTSAASRMFRTSSATVTDAVHKVETDPRKSVHISAHNAVRPTDGQGIYNQVAKEKAQELEKHYLKACSRAEKKGRPKPRRDDYTWSEAWGYPVYLPMYMPLYGAGFYTGGMYPVNPGCMALGAGAVGNCCSGTCGGAVAAGGACAGGASAACASSIGGTVGSCAGGGAGGGVGGACGGGGGGGGGGCGGGGGGGGCGGGGGGGC